ncbi:putative RNA recognition motif domain, nucleotide-binding alpha-beta plait domain superfamily [Dioscorea sansibarensis]
MTIDDENSIYVGGLPYECTDDDLRAAFDIYGAIVAVKIINDREVGGKCYGFVTFTNPRSAVDAINDMDGRAIGGRTVRVNEVRTRGAGRPGFHRDRFRREGEWVRDRGREHNRYRDRNAERSRDRDREYERGPREHPLDRVRERDEHRERDWDMDWDRDREADRGKDRDVSREGNGEPQPKNRFNASRGNGRRSRETSSNSSDEYDDQLKERLEISRCKHEELQQELTLIEGKVEEKEKLVSDLQKRSEKLEGALATVKKLSSQRQSLLTNFVRCYMQSKEYKERLKGCEEELQSLFDMATTEVNGVENFGGRDDSSYPNGKL